MEKTIRRYIVTIHSILGKVFPLVGWTRTCSHVLYELDVD